MEQKITWIHYLITGISIIIFPFFILSCDPSRIEYKLDADIIYVNDTEYLIRYFQYNNITSQRVFAFEIEPNSRKKIKSRGDGAETSLDNCCAGVLEGFQGIKDILIEYENGQKCLIYLSGEGPTTANINTGYKRREISTNYYEFVYIFTEKEYWNAKPCN